MEIYTRFMAFLEGLTDNDTLIIIALAVFMFIQPAADVTSTIVGGFLGYMVKQGGNNGSV